MVLRQERNKSKDGRIQRSGVNSGHRQGPVRAASWLKTICESASELLRGQHKEESMIGIKPEGACSGNTD